MSSQSSQASRAIETLGPAEFQRKVSELVRYMLCQDKKKLPIKRPDINRNVLKEHVRCFQPIFEKAKEFLLNIFGIDVVESEVGKTKSYFLVNDLDTRNEDVIPWSKEVKHSGLLMIIISLIYMSDGVVSDVNVKEFSSGGTADRILSILCGTSSPPNILKRTLKQLGIRKDVNHKEFGDIEKTIQEFVKQTYIIKEKVVTPDLVTFNYKMGPRTMAETSKRRILEFISEVYGVDIQQWKMQYKEIVREEDQQQ